MTAKKSLTLKKYIELGVEEMGVDTFKHQFGVTESSINHWRRGACLPRSPQMQQIVELSGGRVSYKEMIETFNKAQAKKN